MKTTQTQTHHESGLSFMYHMFLCPRNLQIHHALRLLHVFLNTLYMRSLYWKKY